MSLDDRQDDERWADIRKRLEEFGQEPQSGRWAVIKDRLAIAAGIGSIVNFRCSFVEFITFVCNRWAGGEAP